ncbi:MULTISPECIES: rhodanese-like domain-containing protein [Chryseobacterium]|uniref:Thiosulfate sulfurtransferase PspE n=1 Tax=Chryseobacterium salivictor TaxID=2547600 RepID=A0A4P6ZEI9_9FLAO|nr:MULTISPECIES: rhodanese-like domain-containing protein [Chryseobacterium]MDQ0476718.1 phage shock protein E [Chryseobacterium sp. MDT2-18]QBO57895.1 Thiosulfate sulfurtransferase PspE [Chryseobacterium salivictor]
MSLKKIFIVAVISMISWSCKTATPVSEVSRAEVKEMITSPETTLVDVRIPEQFSEKTSPGAINIPLAKIEDHLDFFRKQKQTVVFCNSGKQAAQAVEILKKNGIQNVYDAKTLQNVTAVKKEKK